MSGELPSDVNPYHIEPELSAYAPRPPRIDRDRLMFQAGVAAAASHPSASAALALRPAAIAWFPPPQPASPTAMGWVWPASTVAMSLVAVGLLAALIIRPSPLERVQVVERIVRVPAPGPQGTDPTLAVSSGGLHQPYDDLAAAPIERDTTPVVTLDALPADHMLRVRQALLTDEDAPLSAAGGDTARLSPPSTRGSLMRQLTAPRAAATGATPLFPWSSWLGGK